MIKTLLKSVREYKKDTILTPIFVTLECVMEVFIPLLMADLIDKGIAQGNMNEVVKIGIMLVISALVVLFFGAVAGKTAARASTGFAANLRHDMFYRVQNFSFSNIDKFSTASIVTRLTTDVTNIQNAYQMMTRLAVRAPIMAIFSLIVCFRINAQISMTFLALIPILGIGIFIIIRRAFPLFSRVFKTYDKLNRVVQENLYGIRVVKSFIRGDFENKKFQDISESIYQDFTKAELTLAYNMPLMQLCMYGCLLIISWLGATVIVASGGDATLGLSTGLLTSLIQYAMQILMSLMMLSMVFVMITMAKASAERAAELLTEEPTLSSPENAVADVKDGCVTFENVSFSYSGKSDRQCLTNINLHIESGQTIGILGGTGSAKSSLVQLIPRLYDATQGRILVGGVDVREYDLDALRDNVAMVLQKNVLFSGTIKENLRWGNENATDEQLIHACQLAQADGFIKEFPKGYDTYIEQGGSNVSGGQKQRLCIARALLKTPKILILDDSTSAVDTRTDALIRDAFRKEIPNTTKIIIAQRISSIQDADRILVMENGHAVAFDTHDVLLNSCEIYREVYESQVKGGKDNE